MPASLRRRRRLASGPGSGGAGPPAVPEKPKRRRVREPSKATGGGEPPGLAGTTTPTTRPHPGAVNSPPSSSTAEAARGPHQAGTSFASLGLARRLVGNCERLGMQYPTGIQAMAIPPALAGKNLAGNAKTGTGKTACYCLPALHRFSKDPYGVFMLVLLPIRELAFQVSENLGALGRGTGVQVAEVVGGRDMSCQSKFIMERRHVIVATPGRLADLFRGDEALSQAFRRIGFFVLDEADRLLTQTFEEPLSEILGKIPKQRQTLLFSATITQSITKLRSKFPGELLLLDANPKAESLETLTQQYIFVPRAVQLCYLHYLLSDHFADSSCIVFAPRIELCQLLTTMLEFLGFSVTGLHSLQSQRRRAACLGKFRAGHCRILVATDVASRGLDIPKVAVVINVGLPYGADDYVHRAGRTARAGRPGLVVTVMTEQDVPKVRAIEGHMGIRLELRPTVEEDAIKLLSRTTKARQRAELLLSEVGFEEQLAEHRGKRAPAKQGRGRGKRRKGARERKAATGAPAAGAPAGVAAAAAAAPLRAVPA